MRKRNHAFQRNTNTYKQPQKATAHGHGNSAQSTRQISVGMKYSKTPPKVRQNLSFLINVAKLENCEDIKSDMNGVFCDTCICMWTVEVSKENDVDTLEKKKIDLVSKKSYHVYINLMRNKAGLCHSIFFAMR